MRVEAIQHCALRAVEDAGPGLWRDYDRDTNKDQIIWKESGFDDAAKSKTSTATGFMQMTIPAVDDVNRNTPKGTHFAFSDMLDGGKNIQCGTFYLDMIYRRSGNDVTKALNSYGTGTGYATNLIAAEACLQAAKGKAATIDPEKAKTCLFKIHR